MTFTGTLLPFQPPAYERMTGRQKVLVSYDCGLGKTAISIAASEALMDTGHISAPVLVVCLASLKFQWAKEVQKFSNSTPLVINGTKPERAAQYAQARLFMLSGGADYIIVNYEAFIHDWDELQRLPIGAIIADEATAIKSFRAKRSKRLKQLAKGVPVRFALTGTPMENGRPEEIYSIMQFVDPTVLGPFPKFDAAYIARTFYGGVDHYKNLPELHAALSDAVVRKSQNDADVAPFLPDQIHREPVMVPMGRAVKAVYDRIVKDLLDELAVMSKSGTWDLRAHYGLGPVPKGNEDRGAVMSKVTALRMVVQHPTLALRSADKAANLDGGSMYLYGLFDEKPALRQGLEKIRAYPKLTALIAYLTDHLEADPDAKAVVFTTYVGMVDLIKEHLANVGIQSETYTGRMNARAKEAAKTSFQTDPEVRVLVSSDAGGYGVDLPQANLLVNYDLPWSAGSSIQRNARVRRASSRWPSIIVQDILVEKSIEERLHDMLTMKGAVSGAVIDGDKTNAKGGVDLTLGTLKDFLTNL